MSTALIIAFTCIGVMVLYFFLLFAILANLWFKCQSGDEDLIELESLDKTLHPVRTP